jgi:hypothetical protein
LLAVSYFHSGSPARSSRSPADGFRVAPGFINVDSAVNQGVGEYAGLASGRPADAFALQSNFTVVDSKVNIPVDRFHHTSRNRPLVGQSISVQPH